MSVHLGEAPPPRDSAVGGALASPSEHPEPRGFPLADRPGMGVTRALERFAPTSGYGRVP